MAVLRRERDQSRYELLSVHLVGRGTTCQLELESRMVSTSHAQLRWIGTAWQIHDLDSRNGTFVDGERLEQGERRLLRKNAAIGFGDPDDLFILIDDSAPVAHAIDSRGQRREFADQLLVLPDPDNPAFTIFREKNRWMVEEAIHGHSEPASSGDTLVIDDRTWTLHLPVIVEETLERGGPLRLHDIGLRFTVSRSREHIALGLVHHGGAIELSPRVHLELLLRLAEIRLADQDDPGVAPVEEGWIYVSDLLHQLGREDNTRTRNALHQHVHQAREQIARAGIVGAVELIERRRTTVAMDRSKRAGLMRIGVKRIEIVSD